MTSKEKKIKIAKAEVHRVNYEGFGNAGAYVFDRWPFPGVEPELPPELLFTVVLYGRDTRGRRIEAIIDVRQFSRNHAAVHLTVSPLEKEPAPLEGLPGPFLGLVPTGTMIRSTALMLMCHGPFRAWASGVRLTTAEGGLEPLVLEKTAHTGRGGGPEYEGWVWPETKGLTDTDFYRILLAFSGCTDRAILTISDEQIAARAFPEVPGGFADIEGRVFNEIARLKVTGMENARRTENFESVASHSAENASQLGEISLVNPTYRVLRDLLSVKPESKRFLAYPVFRQDPLFGLNNNSLADSLTLCNWKEKAVLRTWQGQEIYVWIQDGKTVECGGREEAAYAVRATGPNEDCTRFEAVFPDLGGAMDCVNGQDGGPLGSLTGLASPGERESFLKKIMENRQSDLGKILSYRLSRQNILYGEYGFELVFLSKDGAHGHFKERREFRKCRTWGDVRVFLGADSRFDELYFSIYDDEFCEFNKTDIKRLERRFPWKKIKEKFEPYLDSFVSDPEYFRTCMEFWAPKEAINRYGVWYWPIHDLNFITFHVNVLPGVLRAFDLAGYECREDTPLILKVMN